MNLIHHAIRQPVTVTVGVLLILLAGLISLTRLPIQLTPNVESTIVTVTTVWTGASPQEIEQDVVDPQEERLLGLSNLRLLTSSSSQGVGAIRLEFATGTDKAECLREVSDKLRQVADYPENVEEPVVEPTDRENRDYIAWVVFSSTDPEFDIRTLRDFAIDRIEPVLERVAGIAEINVLGGREREMQIRIDPVALAQYGVTPSAFASVIRDTNRNFSAGQLAAGKLDVRLRTIGQYRSIEEIERTVISSTPESGEVLVRDVAEVVETFKEPTGYVRSVGVPVIAINAEREIGSNIMKVMDELRAEVARLNAPGGLLDSEARRIGLDGSLVLTQVYDQTTYIDDAIGLVRTNIWIGGALAIIVLLLFLRSIRSVCVIALAIPISVIGAVVVMVALGRSINVISLAGMAFAVGMVVDNSIVVLENIYRHLEMGKSPRDAALAGTREVWGAVLGATLTTIAVFIPILLIEEEAGQLFRDIALAICAAVGLSLIVAVTVIPTMAARTLRPIALDDISDVGAARRTWGVLRVFHDIPEKIGYFIYRVCGSVTARLAIILALTGASITGTILLMPPADYLPQGNRNLVFGLIIPPPGYNIDQFTDMGVRIEETIRPFWEAGRLEVGSPEYERAVAALPEVPTTNWMTRQPGSPVVPPPLKNYFLVTFGGILFHGGVSGDPRRAVDLLPLFSHATRAEVIPGVISFPFQVPLFQLGGSTGSAVKVQLAGPDLDEVTDCASVVYRQLTERYGHGSVQPEPSNFAIAGPEVQIRPDLVRLSELGLTTSDIGLAVRASGDGAVIDEFSIGGESIDLKIIARDSVDQRLRGDISDLPIATPSGHVVPLASVAEVVNVRAPQEIARVGRQRAVSFQVTAPPGVPLEQTIADLRSMFEEFKESGVIPPTIVTGLAGSASKLEEVRSALLGDGTVIGTIGSSLALALIVVYLLMCVLFQNFVTPLVIMFSVPLATLGGFAALFGMFIWSVSDRYLPMQTMDVLTMLGFIILIGVVVNNAILIVHQSLNFLRGGADIVQGVSGALPPRRAIAEAVRTRVRPIFMGTLTSIGGMAPLVFMPGSGSELYRGLGSVVLGGLLVSTIFTIVLVPLCLSLVLDAREALRGGKDEETEPQSSEPQSSEPEPAKPQPSLTADC